MEFRFLVDFAMCFYKHIYLTLYELPEFWRNFQIQPHKVQRNYSRKKSIDFPQFLFTHKKAHRLAIHECYPYIKLSVFASSQMKTTTTNRKKEKKIYKKFNSDGCDSWTYRFLLLDTVCVSGVSSWGQYAQTVRIFVRRGDCYRCHSLLDHSIFVIRICLRQKFIKPSTDIRGKWILSVAIYILKCSVQCLLLYIYWY